MRFLSRIINYIISVQILSSYCYECNAVVHLLSGHEVFDLHEVIVTSHLYLCCVVLCEYFDSQARYNTFGELNAAKDNLLVVCHALTGNSRLDQWWGSMLGE